MLGSSTNVLYIESNIINMKKTKINHLLPFPELDEGENEELRDARFRGRRRLRVDECETRRENRSGRLEEFSAAGETYCHLCRNGNKIWTTMSVFFFYYF